jgi:hypothetical protein
MLMQQGRVARSIADCKQFMALQKGISNFKSTDIPRILFSIR